MLDRGFASIVVFRLSSYNVPSYSQLTNATNQTISIPFTIFVKEIFNPAVAVASSLNVMKKSDSCPSYEEI